MALVGKGYGTDLMLLLVIQLGRTPSTAPMALGNPRRHEALEARFRRGRLLNPKKRKVSAEANRSLMPNFSRMFVLFAVPQSGYLYNVRISRLQPFAPTLELTVQAASLYDWLKRYGYDWNAGSICDREDVVLARVSEERIEALGFISEPFWEGSVRVTPRTQLGVPIPALLSSTAPAWNSS